MPHMREVKTCDRCRHFKRRCDLIKPSCSRCVQAGVRCSFDVSGTAAPAAANSASNGSASTSNQQLHTALPLNGASQFPPPAPPGNNGHLPMAAQMLPPPPVNGSAKLSGSSVGDSSSTSPGQDNAADTPTNGLISPTTSTESPEPNQIAAGDLTSPQSSNAAGSTPKDAQRVVRKRKRNCLSCLRCHRLKVKCDKELPCGRCKASGNGRECYYSYNKGPNGGKFPCPTAPASSSSKSDSKKPQMATWQVQHKVRGSSHWRELMAKVWTFCELVSSFTLTQNCVLNSLVP